MNSKLKAISLFSGAGGDTLGMELAGIDVIGYVEINKDAILTHKENFPNCKLIGKDIYKISDDIFREYKDIDVIFGGFPCQSFSHGGKKNPTDKRGFLYQEFVRVVKIIKPKVFIGENVKGLLKRYMEDGTLFIDTIISEFEDAGYIVKFSLFDMIKFGIPQKRERVLIYGIRNDLNTLLTLSNDDLPEGGIGKITTDTRKYNKDILSFSLEKALKIENENILDIIPLNKIICDMTNNDLPSEPPPTNLIKCYNNKQISFRTRAKSVYSCVIDIDEFSKTILSTYGRMPRLFVPIKNRNGTFLRPYTIKELQQIQGFPISFIFKGNYLSIISQIGNAIPPTFVCAVMKYISDILFGNIIEYHRIS